jgi:hypothetical protein
MATKKTATKKTSAPTATTGGYSGIPSTKTVTTGGYSGIPSSTKTVTTGPAPATRPLPKGGGKGASGSKLVQPTGTTSKTGTTNKTGTTSKTGSTSKTGTKKKDEDEDVKKKDEDEDVDTKKKDEDEDVKEDAGLAYQKMMDEKRRRNAFALLKDVFNQYDLGELASTIEILMKEGYEAEEATLALKTDSRYNKPYIDRFYGNELRRSAGRNVIDEATYLDLETSYSETLKAYGLQDYFGAGVTSNERKNRQKAIANVIGADISAVEFKDRVSTAVDRVKMADSATKNAFQQFYGIGEADLAKYFLDPTKNLVTLKEKALSAEIGGAAIGQGLAATAASAEDLAKFGISREQAQIGYATIAEELPTAGKLSRIYNEEGITYGQTEAEQATFKGLASAKRKLERLVAKETAQFQGSAGTNPTQGALSTQYLRRGSSAGQF